MNIPDKIITVNYSFLVMADLINSPVTNISGNKIGTVIGLERNIGPGNHQTLVKMKIHDKKIISKLKGKKNIKMGDWFDNYIKKDDPVIKIIEPIAIEKIAK